MEENKGARLRLKPDEVEIIEDYRARKSLLAEECEAAGIPLKKVNYYWYKSEKFSINADNETVSYEEIKDTLISQMDKHSPSYPIIKREPLEDVI